MKMNRDSLRDIKKPLGVIIILGLSVFTISAQNTTNANRDDKQRTQRKLIREIRSELLTLPYYGVFDWLEFEVDNNNVVTLRGQVTRPSLKSDAEDVVKDIDNVKSVRNEIEELPPSNHDDDLRIALYRAIYSGPLFRYSVGAYNPIHIIVNRGRVTLKGVVANEGDKNIAGIRAKTVPGSFEVKNELRVESSERRR